MPFLPSFYTILVAGVPLPPRFLDALRGIQVDNSTDQASVFRLSFELSRTALGDWDALEIDIFRPLVPVQIRLTLGTPLSETLINGYIKDVNLSNGNRPGTSTLQVSGMDALGTLMNHQEISFPWPNLPDSAIVAGILGQYGVTPLVTPTGPTRVEVDTTSTQRGTHARFLQQMARRNGYELYLQPDPLAGTEIGYFGPPKTFLPPQGVLSVDFGAASNLENFNVSFDQLEPAMVIGVQTNTETKLPIPVIVPAATEPPMGLEPTLPRMLIPRIVQPTATDAANEAEAYSQARSIVNRSSRAVQGSGTVDGLKFQRVLRPGLPVAVRGPGRQYSGIYYVTRVSHSISQDSYTQSFGSWRNSVGLTGLEPFIDPLAVVS